MSPSVEALQKQLRHLQSLRDAGSLSDAAFADARAKIERQLVDQVMAGDPTDAAARPSGRMWASVAGFVLLLAAGGYMVTGSPEYLATTGIPGRATNVAAPADGGGEITDAQVAEVIDQMAKRLQEKPDDPIGWALLARAYSAMGRISEAGPAFQKALALSPGDAGLMADYADVMAAQNDGKFTPQAIQLIERALVVEPGNLKALALAGSLAFDNRDYATAVRHWEQVASSLPASSPMMPQVRSSIDQARQLGGLPPGAPPAPGPMAAATPPPAVSPAGVAAGGGKAAAGAGKVSGRVSLSAAVAGQAGPDDTVFILARPADGGRMPLAVIRKQVRDLPAEFTLDDSMAMAPGAKISDHAKLVVTARVSKSGNAMPADGDLVGQSAAVAPGATGLQVEISDVVRK